MTMGEGGAVYTNDSELHRIVNSMRDWGRDCWCPSGHDNTCGCRFTQQFGELPLGYDHKYVYSHFGYNLKVTDMQAAIGCAQLEKLPDFIEARKKNWQYLKDRLKCLDKYLILPEATENSSPSWFGFMMTVKKDAPFTRDQLVRHLEENKIQTRMLFAGNLTKHPCFDEMRNSKSGYRIIGDLKNTDNIMNNSLWVGVYPGMTKAILNEIAKNINTFISQGGVLN
jgi:CDP-6-deoxy-D-xylo-4-hexulose-3-dehydrase